MGLARMCDVQMDKIIIIITRTLHDCNGDPHNKADTNGGMDMGMARMFEARARADGPYVN